MSTRFFFHVTNVLLPSVICLLIERINMNYDRRSAKRWLNRYWTLIRSRRRRSRLRVFPLVARGSWFTHRSEHASTATLQISYTWIIRPSRSIYSRLPRVPKECSKRFSICDYYARIYVPFQYNIRISTEILYNAKCFILYCRNFPYIYVYAANRPASACLDLYFLFELC